MKASRIIYLSAAMLLAGCSAEQTSEQDGALLPIVLGSTVADAPLTRAANDLNNTYLTAGQQVTVRISPTGENNYTDYTYTTAAGGVMNPPAENKPYYPMTGNVDIRAYHPASAATGSSAATFPVAVDQTTDANYIASDLLWADTDNSDNPLTNLAKTASTRTLKFQHKLSKITVNATPDGVAVTSITGITLNNVKRKVTFDPSTGATPLAATDNDPTTVTMSNNGAAIIPPQTINGSFITIVTNAGTAVYAVNKTFAAGHQYTLNITVNAAAIGTTNTITGWTSEGTVNVQPTVEVTNFDIPDISPSAAMAVDLGLPSGTKWANMNVGAVAETDYGTYFAWGETIGYTVSGSTDTAAANNQKTTDHSWDYYWWGSSESALTKYVPEAKKTTNGLNGFYDNKPQLELANDAAHVNWGGNWRMPTQAEIDELLRTWPDYDGNGTKIPGYTWTLCDGSSTKYNDSTVKGWKITRDEGGATIFLPAAGYRDGASVVYQGSGGTYWSSSLNEDYPGSAWVWYFYLGFADVNFNGRYFGNLVRAVCEE